MTALSVLLTLSLGALGGVVLSGLMLLSPKVRRGGFWPFFAPVLIADQEDNRE